VKKTQDTNNYLVFYPSDQKGYRPSALVYPVFFSPGDVYSNRASRNTYDRYSDMRNFSFIKVSYAETKESRENFEQDTGYLNCLIQLTRMKRQMLRVDLLGKITSGIFGTGGELSYSNKNLFKSAEIFSLSFKYTQEVRMDSSDFNFQNYEIGGNLNFEFPRFLFPIKQQNIPKGFRPKTLMGVGVNYVKRQYYARFLTNVVFTYEWSERKTNLQRITHSLSVLDFNLIKMYREDEFDEFFKQYKQRIMERYKDHFLLGTNYKITLTDVRKYVFRARFDLYGNLLYGITHAFLHDDDKYKNDDGGRQYTVWGIPFASGAAVDLDFVYNFLPNRKSALVYHATLGIGLPTWNSNGLPFEKSFYLGGSNSMRGWRLRALGPGSFCDTSNTLDIEKVGDIKFETNLEYRQPLYKVLHLGLFVDAGNIWLMNHNDMFPNAEFAFNRFFKEIAIDAGVGLRLDFSFFVIRLDYAIKFHDPARQDNTWCFKNWKKFKQFSSDGTIVLGIGYAF
jgi:outer membrane protein assembly factor BamA